MGRGLPRVIQVVPQPRLQGVPEELASSHQAVRLQRGQHPAVGGRLALPSRSERAPRRRHVTSGSRDGVNRCRHCFREVWLHGPTRRRLPVAKGLSGRSGLQSL